MDRDKQTKALGVEVDGAALIIWLAIQIRIIGYHSDPPLQLTYGVIACAIAVLAVLIGRDRGYG